MFGREDVIISLTPGCLRVGRRVGAALSRVERIGLDGSAWESLWSADLRPLDERLLVAIRQVGALPGMRVHIVYAAPSSIADVHTVPTRGAGALQAARLAMDEVVAGGSGGVQTDVRILCEEPGATPRTHVLALAERDQTCEILAAWARRAGLQPDRLIPLRGVQLTAALGQASRWKSPRRGAMVYLDGEGTVIFGRENGRTLFIRSVDFGYSMLADAIVRGSRGVQAGIPCLDRVRASEILFAAGFPSHGTVIDASTGLSAEAVLPLMQPVLQRYTMEIRQTLRFGFGDLEAASADVVLTGPGAAIPEMAPRFSDQLELAVDRMDGTPAPVNHEAGELVEANQHFDELPSFLAPSEKSRRVRGRLRVAMACGLVLGGLAVAGATTFTTRTALEFERTKLAMQPQIDLISAHRDEIESAHVAVGKLGSARTAIEQTLGQRSDWRAGIAAIERLSGEEITIGEINASYGSDGAGEPVLLVRGVASSPPQASSGDGATGDDSLGQFVQRLSTHPTVVAAQIVSSRTDAASDATKRVFTISVRLVSAPAWSVAEVTEETP